GDDRPVVTDAAACPDGVVGARLLPKEALRVEPLGVVGEALVHPHIGVVLRGNVVSEPLVGAFVHDDEVPLQAEARARGVAPAITVRVPVAVGDGALVLHSCVRHQSAVAYGNWYANGYRGRDAS